LYCPIAELDHVGGVLFGHIREGVFVEDVDVADGEQWLLIKKAPQRQGFMYRVIKFSSA
jgi:hypothetical protein